MIDWSAKRKRVRMLVEVSIPENMTPEQARREVREMINHGAGYYTNPGEEVKAIAVKPEGAH